MKITIQSVPPVDIRYSTCGDWFYCDNGELQITVPEYGNDDSAFLVALHELVEAWACKKAGIKEESVFDWDNANLNAEEPGDIPEAPYHVQHRLATDVEKAVCEALGIDWEAHNEWVQSAADEVDFQHEKRETDV